MNKTGVAIVSVIITGAIVFATNFAVATSFSDVLKVPSLVVGKTDGSGGVTQFNGTMINATPNKPITMADDLRVDGGIWRGKPNDSQPAQIKDSLDVSGSTVINKSLDVKDTLNVTNSVNSGDVFTDSVAAKELYARGTGAVIGSSANRWNTGYFGIIDSTFVDTQSIKPVGTYSTVGSTTNRFTNGYYKTVNATTIEPDYTYGSSVGSIIKPWGSMYVNDIYTSYMSYKHPTTTNTLNGEGKEQIIECKEENYGKMTFSKDGINGGKPNQFYGCTGTGWKEL